MLPRLVADKHRPAAQRRLSRHGDVTAEADQHAAAGHAGRRRPGGAIGAEALGSGSEVEPHSSGQSQAPAVEPHRLPARHVARLLAARLRRRRPAAARRNRGRSPGLQTAPPTVGSTRPPVHSAAASATAIASASPSLTMQLPRRGASPGKGTLRPGGRAEKALDQGDLRVVAEPARLLVQQRQFGVDGGERPARPVGRPDHHPGGRAQGIPLCDAHGRSADIHRAPVSGPFRAHRGHQLSR